MHAAPRHRGERVGGTWRLLEGDLVRQPGRRETKIARDAHRLLAPVEPSKMVCIGLNYKDHAAEQNKPLPTEPLMFIKPSTAVVGPGRADRVSPGIGRVDHEAEVGVVIGRRAYRVPARRARELRARADVRQRRHRPRAAAEGRPVHAREGLRHVRADRPVHRGRASTAPRRRRRRAGSTARGGRTRRRAS